MLDRHAGPVRTYGFLLAVEIEQDGPSNPEAVTLKLSDSLAWVEGIGAVDIDCLGEIDVNPEAPIEKAN